jgi:hypothetical protein
VTPYRERDIRNAIRDALEQTGAFDGVYLTGLPEDRGEASGQTRVAVIEPWETVCSDVWDDTTGDLVMTGRMNLWFLGRNDDPQIRDETTELLLNVAASALNGQVLAGATLISQTRIRSWSWHKARPPERRIMAVFEFQYLVNDWTGLNTTE